MPEPEVKEVIEDELTVALAASTETKVDSEEPGEKTDEELAAEAKAKEDAEKETITVKKVDYEKDQKSLQDLRSLTLQQKRDQATMTATLGRLQRNQETLAKPAAIPPGDEEDLDEDGKPKAAPAVKLEEPTTIEKLEEQLKELGTTNAAQFEMLLDVMGDTEKYKDVNAVCSDNHFRDIVHAVATQMVKDQGADYNEASLNTELHIWSQTNPYKYMYGLIKEHHPDYASAKVPPGGDKGAEKDEGKETTDADGKVIPKVVKSIASADGSHDTSTGWTAKRIDEMDEDQLGTVPPDIYQKYMDGELD